MLQLYFGASTLYFVCNYPLLKQGFHCGAYWQHFMLLFLVFVELIEPMSISWHGTANGDHCDILNTSSGDWMCNTHRVFVITTVFSSYTLVVLRICEIHFYSSDIFFGLSVLSQVNLS